MATLSYSGPRAPLSSLIPSLLPRPASPPFLSNGGGTVRPPSPLLKKQRFAAVEQRLAAFERKADQRAERTEDLLRQILEQLQILAQLQQNASAPRTLSRRTVTMLLEFPERLGLMLLPKRSEEPMLGRVTPAIRGEARRHILRNAHWQEKFHHHSVIPYSITPYEISLLQDAES
ncbi:hypothetical protein KEM56_003985 [Ascosphaera pollenicola]|nr:hypothetical protein KEM56_003985 [Ascosphaera pollenicola]